MFRVTTMRLRIIAGERGLRAISFHAEDPARVASIDEADLQEGMLDKAVEQLEEYFVGTRGSSIYHSIRSARALQSVWMLLRTIPYGQTISYGNRPADGDPEQGQGRAANGKNPLSIVVPCHRAIGSSGHVHRLRRRARGQVALARPRAPAAGEAVSNVTSSAPSPNVVASDNIR